MSFALIFGTVLTGISAQEPMPRDEFMKITKDALDALDKLDTIFSGTGSTKMEARLAENNLETALTKYDLHESYKITKAQDEIIINISMADLTYMPMVIAGSVDVKLFNIARTYTRKAHVLFEKYKTGKK